MRVIVSPDCDVDTTEYVSRGDPFYPLPFTFDLDQ